MGHIFHDSVYMKCPEQTNPHRQTGFWLPGVGGKQAWGVTANVYGASSGDDEYVLQWDSIDGCITLWIYWKALNYIFEKGEFYGILIISQKSCY